MELFRLLDLSPNIIRIINRTKSSGIKLIKHFEKFTQSKKIFETTLLGFKPLMTSIYL